MLKQSWFSWHGMWKHCNKRLVLHIRKGDHTIKDFPWEKVPTHGEACILPIYLCEIHTTLFVREPCKGGECVLYLALPVHYKTLSLEREAFLLLAFFGVPRTFYHPCLRTGNNFSQTCLSVCLSFCLSVCSGCNFWTTTARKFIFSIQIHLDHI